MYLAQKAKALPNKPGCYLMKNSQGSVIYIGKAKDLRKRVITYFNKSLKTMKTDTLVKHVVDFDFIITSSEAEALILENNLIKEHSPKYNILLKDDKSYPYIMIDYSEPYPKLTYLRRVRKGKKKIVLGPFVYGHNVNIREVVKTLMNSFRLRSCSLREFRSRENPCILYQMNHCVGPCCREVSEDDYLGNLQYAKEFFQGKGKKIIKLLKRRMHLHAKKEKFEQAVALRDSITILENFLNHYMPLNVELEGKDKDIDIISFFQGPSQVDISIYLIRSFMLMGHKNFYYTLTDRVYNLKDEIMSQLMQYYTKTKDPLPELIILPFKNEKLVLFENALNYGLKNKIEVRAPGRKFNSLMKLVTDVAFECQKMRIKDDMSEIQGLDKLKELLGLEERPQTLECFDIAVWQGRSPTASKVVFRDGMPSKQDYRHYHLNQRPEGNNDYAMIEELIDRRIKSGNLPDIFIIDGGLGQVNSILKVLKKYQVSIPVVGIAKSKVKSSDIESEVTKKTEERLILHGGYQYLLKENQSLFNIIVKMRNEAHRFSRRLHHKEENKRFFHSFLDDISGVGPIRKRKIIKFLNSVSMDVNKILVEDIKKELKVSDDLACRIVKAIQRQKKIN